MKQIVKFIASNIGRIIRGGVGAALAYMAYLLEGGSWFILVLVVSIVLFMGALFDICLLGVLTGSGVRGEKIRGGRRASEASATTVVVAILGLVALGVIWYQTWSYPLMNTANTENISTQTNNEELAAEPAKTDPVAVTENEKSQNDMLVFLIEEEKLAHDVYTVMYQKYGAQVFGSILNSEETHQGRVLTLLQARNISDPRSALLGKFSDPDLQDLYDSLIAQGEKSAAEAYKVGVAIEEKDIQDITNQLATATDSDIVTALQALRNGSENHLRAFNRQLGQY